MKLPDQIPGHDEGRLFGHRETYILQEHNHDDPEITPLRDQLTVIN